jgi:hypothetical protein
MAYRPENLFGRVGNVRLINRRDPSPSSGQLEWPDALAFLL